MLTLKNPAVHVATANGTGSMAANRTPTAPLLSIKSGTYGYFSAKTYSNARPQLGPRRTEP